MNLVIYIDARMRRRVEDTRVAARQKSSTCFAGSDPFNTNLFKCVLVIKTSLMPLSQENQKYIKISYENQKLFLIN